MIDAGFDSRQIYRIIDEGLLMGQQDQYSTLQFICLKLKGREKLFLQEPGKLISRKGN